MTGKEGKSGQSEEVATGQTEEEELEERDTGQSEDGDTGQSEDGDTGQSEESEREEQARKLALEWVDLAEKSTDPKTAYDLACHFASAKNYVDAAKYLRIGVRHPLLKELAALDPEFTTWRESEEHKAVFREIVADKPPTDFWDLEMFAALKPKLIEGGVPLPVELVDYPDQQGLRWFLQLQKPPYERLVDLSRLIAAANAASLPDGASDLRLELVSSLIDAGVERPSAVPPEWLVKVIEKQPDTVVDGKPVKHPDKVVAGKALKDSAFYAAAVDIVKKYFKELSDEQLIDWLAGVRPPSRDDQPTEPVTSTPAPDPLSTD